MPSIELSKLQGVRGVRSLSESDRAQIDQPAHKRLETAQKGVSKQGIANEVETGLNASDPPVDAARVAEIRKALQDGTYPLVPTKIADAMIAARVGFGLGE